MEFIGWNAWQTAWGIIIAPIIVALVAAVFGMRTCRAAWRPPDTTGIPVG